MENELPRPDKFNVRAYGICLREGYILLVRENMNGFKFTKFPGGGIEYGEGILDGLKREIGEELKLEIEKYRHFYTTDFFQRSAFRNNEQLISVYYMIEIKGLPAMADFPVQSIQPGNHTLEFFWVALDKLGPEQLTFPIDKKVVSMILSGNPQIIESFFRG